MRLTDLDERAADHHGVITLGGSGLSRSGWYRAVRSGLFEQLHPGVARLAGTARTYRQRTAAAVLASSISTRAPSESAAGAPNRSRALASHRAAASLWLNDPDPPPAAPKTPRPVDLIVPDRRSSRRLTDVVVHRPRDIGRLTPQTVAGIRCTNILRTLLDLGAVAPDEVHPLLGHALATRLADLDAVETVLLEQARPGRAGARALRSAVDDWAIDAKPADSVLEIAFRRLVTRFQLPPIEFHPLIEGWEVDFRFAGTRVLIECDGWLSHGLDRRQFERDRRRDADLGSAGWIVSRHTYRAITHDASTTAGRIRALLAHGT